MKLTGIKSFNTLCESTKGSSLVLFKDTPDSPINGVGRLPDAMTINSITEYPVYRYSAGGDLADVNEWKPWIYGETLNRVVVATPPTPNHGSPGLGYMDDSVLLNGSDYYKATSTTVSSTHDRVMCLAFKMTANTGTIVICGTGRGGSLLDGWNFYTSGGTSLYFAINDGIANAVLGPVGVTAEKWYYVEVYCDYGGQMRMFVNGVYAYNNTIAGLGSTANSGPIVIGANYDGTLPFNGGAVAYLAYYQRVSWLDTDDQATLAEERAGQFWGWRPQFAKGTAVPTVRTRASNAFVDKIETDGTRKLYSMAYNIPRCCSRLDSNGELIKGYLSEGTTNNECDYSQTLNSWGTKTRITIGSDTAIAPDGTLTADGLIASADNDTHFIYHVVSIAAYTQYTASFWAKADAYDCVQCRPSSDNITVTFGLYGDGVVNKIYGPTTNAYIENWGDGWYRCIISYYLTFGSGQGFSIFPSTGLDNADRTFLGDGITNDIYVWGVQKELGYYASSYVPTPSTATATRQADVLRYKGDDGNVGGISSKTGEICAKLLVENYNSAYYKTLVNLNSGIDGYISLGVDTNDLPSAITTTGTNDGIWVGSTDLVNGVIHDIAVPFQTNKLGPGVVDGELEGTADLDCSVPNNVDGYISIGADMDGLTSLNGLVSDIEIFEQPVRVREVHANYDTTFVVFKDTPETPINGVERLDAAMTINSITEYPVFRYNAGGGLVDTSEWRPWGYGEALDQVVVATAPTPNSGSPLMGPLDDSVKFNASDYYRADNNDFADITTEDFVFETVVTISDGVNLRVFGHRLESGTYNGYTLYISGNALRFYIDEGATAATQISGALTLNSWVHALWFFDRSGSVQCYINGVASGLAVGISGVAGTLTAASPFVIGAAGNGTNVYDKNIAYVAMWKRAAWLDTHLQATVAAERFSKFAGTYPQFAAGTAIPTVQTRNDVAYLDKIESDGTTKYYLVGAHWPRVVHRLDPRSFSIKGLLAETTAENLLSRSWQFSIWTANYGVADVRVNNLAIGPLNNAASWAASSTSGNHWLSLGALTTAATYVFSVFAKAGAKTWFSMRDYTIANTTVWFDVGNGEVGTVQSAITSYGIIPCGDGWFRCFISYTDVAATNQKAIQLADSNNDLLTEGDGVTVDLYLAGAQHELGNYPSSPIITSGATDIRVADNLRYKGDDGNIVNTRRGRFDCRVLLPDVDRSDTPFVVDLNDGGSTSDRVRIDIVGSSGDVPRTISAASGESGGAVVGSTDVCDGYEHDVSVAWQDNNLRLFVDGFVEGSDVDCGMPDDIDRIDVAQSLSATGQLNGIISDIEISKIPTRDPGIATIPETVFTIFDDTLDIPINGVANLSPALTINSITEYPMYRYVAGGDMVDLNLWRAWTYGGDCEITTIGAATDPTPNSGSPLLGPLDDSVKFNAGKIYKAIDAPFADVTTEDMVFEIVWQYKSTSSYLVARAVGAGGLGYELLNLASGSGVRFRFNDGVGGLKNISSAALTDGHWYHAIWFIDRSGSGQCYINGVASAGAVAVSTSAGSISNGNRLSVGGNASGTFAPTISKIAYFAMWKKQAWLDTHLQATIAKNRFLTLTGMKPQASHVGIDTTPLSSTRSSNATLEKYDIDTGTIKFYDVGTNWLRTERWLDEDGRIMVGYRSELTASNYVRYSHAFENWTLWDPGDGIPDGYDGPWGAGTAYAFCTDSTSGQHYIAQTILDPGTNATGLRFAVKAGSKTWCNIRENGTAVNAYFNLATGAVGTTSGGLDTPLVRYLGDGWWELSIFFTGFGAACTGFIYPTDGDGSITCSGGDGITPAIYLAGAHAEPCVKGGMSSWIKVPAVTAVARSNDLLAHTITSSTLDENMAVIADVCCRGAFETDGWIFVMNDGTDTNSFGLRCFTSTQKLNIYSTGAGTASDSTDLVNGVLRRIGCNIKTNSLEIWNNGDRIARDIAYSSVSGIKQIAIGMARAASQLPASPVLIRRLIVYRNYQEKMDRKTKLD